MSPSRSTGAKLARTLMLLISTAIVGGAFACIAAQRDETAARPPQTPQVVHYFNRLGTPFIEYRPTASHFYTGYNLEYGLYGKAACTRSNQVCRKAPDPQPHYLDNGKTPQRQSRAACRHAQRSGRLCRIRLPNFFRKSSVLSLSDRRCASTTDATLPLSLKKLVAQ